MAHLAGRACRTTELDPPIAVAYTEEFNTLVEARRREAQIKRWSGATEEALAPRDMAKLKELAKSRKIQLSLFLSLSKDSPRAKCKGCIIDT